jgi:hypothetical protein
VTAEKLLSSSPCYRTPNRAIDATQPAALTLHSTPSKHSSKCIPATCQTLSPSRRYAPSSARYCAPSAAAADSETTHRQHYKAQPNRLSLLAVLPQCCCFHNVTSPPAAAHHTAFICTPPIRPS